MKGWESAAGLKRWGASRLIRLERDPPCRKLQTETTAEWPTAASAVTTRGEHDLFLKRFVGRLGVALGVVFPLPWIRSSLMAHRTIRLRLHLAEPWNV